MSVAPSTSLPVFSSTARDLESKLAGDASPEARRLAHEAGSLASLFSEWEHRPPEAHQRSSAVSALLELQRRVMDHLTRGDGYLAPEPPRRERR